MDPQVYQRMAEIEDRHWWFVGRRKIISKVLSRLGGLNQGRILEVGSGTGGNLTMLASFGEVKALEPDQVARDLALQKGCFDIRPGALPNNIPFELHSFDLVVAFDVLEHLDNDLASIEAMMACVNKDGMVVITVPAYPILWSSHDRTHHHKRRYTKASLLALLKKTDYEPVYISHFNTVLAPAIFVIRLINNMLGRKHTDDKLPSDWLNRCLTWIFSLEHHLLGRFSMPLGISLIVAIRKNQPS